VKKPVIMVVAGFIYRHRAHIPIILEGLVKLRGQPIKVTMFQAKQVASGVYTELLSHVRGETL